MISPAISREKAARSTFIAEDLERDDAIPYFNCDVSVTNAQIRAVLRGSDENARLFWMARIMREARTSDVWRYLSLRQDVMSRRGLAQRWTSPRIADYRRCSRWFLTGGGALSGFHYKHRTTENLDLLATPERSNEEGEIGTSSRDRQAEDRWCANRPSS